MGVLGLHSTLTYCGLFRGQINFFAYSTAFTGGVVVATANRDSTLFIKEVVTAPASNGGYNIKSFNCNGTGNNPTVVESFFAFNDSTSIGGLSLAVGFLDSNQVEDIVVGTTTTQFGVILNQNYGGGIQATPFEGFDGAIRSGVAVDQNGVEYAVAAAGPGGGPVIAAYGLNGNSLSQTDLLFVLNQQFRGGLFMATTLSEFVG